MDCHRTLFTLSHADPSFSIEQLRTSWYHYRHHSRIVQFPNKRHNCPNLRQRPIQPHTTHAHAEDVEIDAEQMYIYISSMESCRFHEPLATGLRADITHNELCLSFQTMLGRALASDSSKVDFDNVGCCDDKRWFFAHANTHTHTHRHKTINNGKPKENLEILLIFFFCVCWLCWLLVLLLLGVLYVHTPFTAPKAAEEDEWERERQKTHATEGKTIFCWFCFFLVGYTLLRLPLLAQFTGSDSVCIDFSVPLN